MRSHIGFVVAAADLANGAQEEGLESRIEGVGDRRVEGSKFSVRSRCGVTAADLTDVDYMGMRVDPEEAFEMGGC